MTDRRRPVSSITVARMTLMDDDWWDDEDWLEDEDEEAYEHGFESWEHLTEQLAHRDWLGMDCDALRISRIDDDTLIVLEQSRLRARHRRLLHKAGFRRVMGAFLMQWRWTYDRPPLPDDPAERFRESVQQVLLSSRAVAEKAVHVAHDLKAEPQDIGIELATERMRDQERRLAERVARGAR